MSDGWAAYAGISQMAGGYGNGVVNHKYNFVNPTDCNVHTQSIEATWNSLKSQLKTNFGTLEGQLGGHLFNYMWRRYHNRDKLLNQLLIEMRTFRQGMDIEAAYDSTDSDDSSSSSSDDSNCFSSSSYSHSELDSASESEHGGLTDDGVYVSDHDRNKNIPPEVSLFALQSELHLSNHTAVLLLALQLRSRQYALYILDVVMEVGPTTAAQQQ